MHSPHFFLSLFYHTHGNVVIQNNVGLNSIKDKRYGIITEWVSHTERTFVHIFMRAYLTYILPFYALFTISHTTVQITCQRLL